MHVKWFWYKCQNIKCQLRLNIQKLEIFYLLLLSLYIIVDKRIKYIDVHPLSESAFAADTFFGIQLLKI